MNNKSSRHHYIPKFLINGFKNSDGLLYIYNKKKDEIKIKPRSSKSIFFEEDGNTVEITEKESSSLIEDEFFQKLDNESSKLLRSFQGEEITQELLKIENQGKFQFFLINLFWRIPLTDYAVRDLIKRAVVSSIGIDPEFLRNDETFYKLQRVGLYSYTIDQLDYRLAPKPNYYVTLREFDSDLFILGDNPILFKSTPKKFTDLNYIDYIFAVSSERIYTQSLEEFGSFTRSLGYDFNALIIDQSIKYVVSGSRKLLENSVKYYRKLKEENFLFQVKDMLFK